MHPNTCTAVESGAQCVLRSLVLCPERTLPCEDFVKQPVPDHRTVVIALRVRVRVVSFFGFSVGLLHSASEQGDFKIASRTDALMVEDG